MERIPATPRPGEPGAQLAGRPALTLFLATRPAFLSATAGAVLVGLAAAAHDAVPWRGLAAVATVLLALTAHAAVNVINDWADALNGTDDANVERLFPFTGGSRFIQNGVLTPAQTRRFALVLLVVTVVGGLLLVAHTGPALFWVGLAGVAIGWGYSAPPLALNSRGLGELCVVAGFALVVAGADCVQRQSLSLIAAWAGVSHALMLANLLYVNQFPDRNADLLAGKRHWVARLPVASARWGYVLLLMASAAALVTGVAGGVLPLSVAMTVPAYGVGAAAAARVLRDAANPSKLGPAIGMTLSAALMHAVLLSAALWLG